MTEQYDIFGNVVEVKPTQKPDNKEKRNWENAFQRWSNKSITKTNITEPYGVCGYGSMCDYCKDNTYGRPCVRALNEMCREKRITIDYKKKNFEDIWNGVFYRLIELIKQGENNTPCTKNEDIDCTSVKCTDCVRESIADYLLANGVIVPVRCKDCIHAVELDKHCDISRTAYRHCGLLRGEETKYVWHKYKKYYKDYSIVEPNDFCSCGIKRGEDNGKEKE